MPKEIAKFTHSVGEIPFGSSLFNLVGQWLLPSATNRHKSLADENYRWNLGAGGWLTAVSVLQLPWLWRFAMRQRHLDHSDAGCTFCLSSEFFEVHPLDLSPSTQSNCTMVSKNLVHARRLNRRKQQIKSIFR